MGCPALSLGPVEVELLGGVLPAGEHLQSQIESLWAFAWSLGLTPILDPTAYCGDDLVTLMPDLRAEESLADWRMRVVPELLPTVEIYDALDLLYAMTWGLVDARLNGRPTPGTVAPYVHWERRRALEFVRMDPDISHSDWDAIDLST